MNEKILNEVKMAYADCNDNIAWEDAFKTRKLHFKASEYVPTSEAISILEAADIYYNEFSPDLLKYISKDAMVLIAREHSVCIYVRGDGTIDECFAAKMKADEWSYDEENKEYRLWWD